MLSGSQLDFAYNTLDIDNGFEGGNDTFAPAGLNDMILEREKPLMPSKQVQQVDRQRQMQMQPEKAADLMPKGLPIQAKDIPGLHSPQQQQPPVVQSQKKKQQEPYYDASSFNKQFEQQQQVNAYLKQLQSQQYQQPPMQMQQQESQGYFDKLFSKKKEFFKLIQWVLIIVLAISLHFIIKHYLKQYLSGSDLSPEREFMIRALYPIGVLFILWNLRVFSKP